MIKSIFLKQTKPLTVKILGGFLVFILCVMLYEGTLHILNAVPVLIVAVVLLSYSFSIEVTSSYANKKHFQLFGCNLFKYDFKIIFPDYIVVFSTQSKGSFDWGPIAALGKNSTGDCYVIRFFKGSKHYTVYRSNSRSNAEARAIELSKVLNVELITKK